MRVLWISPNGGNYNKQPLKGTGGWICALQDAFNTFFPDVELGIVFIGDDDLTIKDSESRTAYFSINSKSSHRFKDLFNNLRGNENYFEELYASKILKVISEYAPDIVHVWGIEHSLSAVIPYIKCPYVVHIQGLTSLYKYTYLPPFVSLRDLRRFDPWWSPSTLKKLFYHSTQMDLWKIFQKKAERELRVSPYVKNWIGRTEWDKTAVRMISPGSNYFHCEEIMRGDFSCNKWKYHFDGDKLYVQSSINETWYKGIDIILKTADILRKKEFSFEWNVYGVDPNSRILHYFEKQLKIKAMENGVIFKGRVPAQEIKQGLLHADVYVHPSYIENSSNAIAESMMMGVPTIALYAGGNPSMLKDDSGVLVAVNEPFVLASEIISMSLKEKAEVYSSKSLVVAKQRQNTEKTVGNLVEIYKTIINNG